MNFALLCGRLSSRFCAGPLVDNLIALGAGECGLLRGCECIKSSAYRKIWGMRFRKLRFAWSVFWGLACVLLIVLWTCSSQPGGSKIIGSFNSINRSLGVEWGPEGLGFYLVK